MALAAFATAAASGQTPDLETIRNADAGWVDTWQNEIEHRMGLLNAAYSLTPEMQEALRAELQARLLQQYAYEQTEMKKLIDEAQAMTAGGKEPDEATSEDFGRRAMAMDANMPLNEAKVVAWLDERLPAAPAEKAEYKQRWTELQDRRWNQQWVGDEDTKLTAGRKAEVIQSRLEGVAEVTPDNGEPIPPGEKGARLWPTVGEARAQQGTVHLPRPKYKAKTPEELEALREQQLREKAELEAYQKSGGVPPDGTVPPTENIAGHQAPPARQPIPQPAFTPPPAPQAPAKGEAPARVTAPPAPPPLAPAPPLDDWDRHVAGIAAKYGFDEAQRTKAESILKDLKRRANHYRMSRANDIARAELVTDAKSRETQLREIHRPLDALFEELKQRLEALPTGEQRKKAGGGK